MNTKMRIFKYVKYFAEVVKKEEKKVKIDNYYTFMEENIKNYEEKKSDNQITSNCQFIQYMKDNNKVLLDILKCPMTDSDLELSDEGLKVGHITYPKRNGIYILVEDEAKFNF